MNAELPSVDSLRNAAGNVAQQVTNAVSNPAEAAKSLGDSLESAKSGVSESLSGFSSSASAGLGAASASFLDSNSLVAKFAFLLLVIIFFIGLFYVGVKLIAYFTSPPSKVVLMSGLATGGAQLQFPQNPQVTTNVISRSNNAKSGMEFTWSVWINVTGVPAPGTYAHVFSKGSSALNNETSKLASPNNGPGVYLVSTDDYNSIVSLCVFMDAVNFSAATVGPAIIANRIPIGKWVHVAIRLQNNTLDLYVNGSVSGRYQFTNVPKQNFDDVFVGGIAGTTQQGFSGNMSNLTYYNKALGVFSINNIIMAGPSLVQSSATNATASLGFYTYLSNMWYSRNQSQPAASVM